MKALALVLLCLITGCATTQKFQVSEWVRLVDNSAALVEGVRYEDGRYLYLINNGVNRKWVPEAFLAPD